MQITIDPVVDTSYLRNGAGVDPSIYGVGMGDMTRRYLRMRRVGEGKRLRTCETPSPVPDSNRELNPSFESYKSTRDAQLKLF